MTNDSDPNFPRLPFIFIVFIMVISFYLSNDLINKAGRVMVPARREDIRPRLPYASVMQRFKAQSNAQRKSTEGIVPKPSRWEEIGRYILTRGYDAKTEVLGRGSEQWMLRGYTKLKYFLNDHFYRLALRDFPLMPLCEQANPPTLIERSAKPFLFPAPICLSPSQEESLRRHVAFFKALREQHPGLNIFIFNAQLAQYSRVYDELVPGGKYQLTGEKASEQFSSGLPPSISYARFEYGLPQYREYYYRTDHHWTVKGGWAAYVQALKLIRTKVPVIGDAVPPGRLYKVDKIHYRGAYAKTSAYEDVSDELWDFETGLPPYEIYFNDRIRLPRSDREEILRVPYNAFENFYALYWGMDYGLLHYQSAPGRRNLLMFVDSFSNCMEAYFTAHYSNIYVIDLRVFGRDMGGAFDLETFLQNYPVDDVLFFLGSGYALLEAEDYPLWEVLREK